MADKPEESKPKSYRNPLAALATAHEKLADQETGPAKAYHRNVADKARKRAAMEPEPDYCVPSIPSTRPPDRFNKPCLSGYHPQPLNVG